MLSVAAVFGGAGFGALLRWVLALALNPVFPTVPLGTLSANVIGGFLMGLAVQLFAAHPSSAPELRLLLTTGFLGGFTTFSTFSAEVVDLIGRRLYGWSLIHVSAHLFGSLALTILGLEAARLLTGGRP